jgi:hypothetical protein
MFLPWWQSLLIASLSRHLQLVHYSSPTVIKAAYYSPPLRKLVYPQSRLSAYPRVSQSAYPPDCMADGEGSSKYLSAESAQRIIQTVLPSQKTTKYELQVLVFFPFCRQQSASLR